MPDSDVSDVGFAEFVAVLLVETLDSIVASHASQEDRLRALDAALAAMRPGVPPETRRPGLLRLLGR